VEKSKVYFRADGNATIGLGHVIRCLAIADMISDDFDCYFLIRSPEMYIQEQILKICKSIIVLNPDEIKKEAELISEKYLSADDIIVLDGYSFETNYQKTIKESKASLVCVDDIHDYHFFADAIINHAGGLSTQLYSAEPYTKYYLGLEYTMLRKEFLSTTQSTSDPDTINNNVFICLGGADPNNDTTYVLDNCFRVQPESSYYLVLGGSYIHRSKLDIFLRDKNVDLTILQNLSAREMSTYMRKCKSAITSPSTISYEYLSIGGFLYLHQIAENQNDIYKYFIIIPNY